MILFATLQSENFVLILVLRIVVILTQILPKLITGNILIYFPTS